MKRAVSLPCIVALACGPRGDPESPALDATLSAPSAAPARSGPAPSASAPAAQDAVLDPSPTIDEPLPAAYAAIFEGGAEWPATWKTSTTFYEGGELKTSKGGGEGVCFVRGLSRRKWGLVLETSCSGLTALRPDPFYLATSTGLYVIDSQPETDIPILTRSRLVLAKSPAPSSVKLEEADGTKKTVTVEARGEAWCRTEHTVTKVRDRSRTICLDKKGFLSGSLREKPAPGAPTPKGGWQDPVEESFELTLTAK